VGIKFYDKIKIFFIFLQDDVLPDQSICQCMCRVCSIPESRSISTQTDHVITAVKGIQAKPTTRVKGIIAKPFVSSKGVTTIDAINSNLNEPLDLSKGATGGAAGVDVTMPTSKSDEPLDLSVIPGDHENSDENAIFAESDDEIEEDDYDDLNDPDYNPEDDHPDEDTNVNNHEEMNSSNGERNFLVSEENLRELFRTCRCPRCGSAIQHITFDNKNRGSLLKVRYSCMNGHTNEWFSQPLLKSMALGNVLISCATLFTGLTYERVKQFADTLSLPILSKSQFYQIQSRYLFPVIHTAYTKQKEAIISACGDDELTLIGDGRSDSPGLSYLYSFIHILHVYIFT
jgi:hypothetical protein